MVQLVFYFDQFLTKEFTVRKTLFGLSLKKEDPSEERARLFVQGAVDQASEYRTPTSRSGSSANTPDPS